MPLFFAGGDVCEREGLDSQWSCIYNIPMAGIDEQRAREMAQAVADQCIAKRVRFVNRVITNIYDTALRPLGIKANQAGILVLLFLEGGLSPGDIGRALRMEKSTVSRNVERMKKKGWIKTASKDDQASQIVRITPEGGKVLAAAHGRWTEAQKEAVNLLGEEGVRSVRGLYDRLSGRECKE